ncbi:MAG: hypothetical protein ACD_63C00023G0005 [uncultured bacterium]|nr:MAG: hypothetical protein ACD_63C00023G0005 [uncultured bacterium]
MPELRLDPITREWVILAPERAKRPEGLTLSKKKEVEASEHKDCFFCEGNEKETPSEVLAYSENESRKKDGSGWKVRVFPNKFPVLVSGGKFEVRQSGIYESADAVGFHEIIATVDHCKPPALFSSEEMEMMLRAYEDRFNAHCVKDVVKYVLIIYNHGRKAGASLAHPHSQLFAVPVISIFLKRELDGARNYFEKNKKCVFCDMMEKEVYAEKGKRVVFENDGFIAFEPYASKNPFETWILPKKHKPYFQIVDYKERVMLGDCLRTVLKKLYKGLNDPSFNYYIKSAPCDENNYQDYYHWHLEILPRLATRAGFEYGTGIIVNTMDPDEAAVFLREVKI